MTADELRKENEELRRRLEEAEETLTAIRTGAVDAFLVASPDGDRVYTLEAADRPYRRLVEEMQQGAAMLQTDGTIVYGNRSLAELLGMPHERLIGTKLDEYIAPADRSVYDNLLWQVPMRSGRGEARLRRVDGALVPAFLTFSVLPPDCGVAVGVLVTDLTSQKHHEELSAAHQALQESEAELQSQRAALFEERELLRVTLASIGDAVITTDTDGRVTSLNAVAAGLTGWTEQEAVGKPLDAVFRIVNEKTRDAVENPATRALRDGVVVGLANHTVLLAKDGTNRPIDDSAAPIWDASGRVVGCVLTFRDISERRMADDAIRASEERYRRTLDEIAVPTLLHADDDRIYLVNKAWTEITGYDLSHIPTIGAWTERAYGMRHASVKEYIDTLFDAGVRVDNGEWEVTTATGQKRVWHFYSTPVGVESGGQRMLVSTAVDVTVQKEAERQLRASEERYRTLVEQVREHAIFGTDLAGRATTWNEGVRRVLGFEEAEFIGQDLVETIYNPEDVATGVVQRELDEAAAKGSVSNDRWMRRKDGTQFWAAGITTARRDEAGRIVGFTKVMRDQTDRKRLEDDLRSSQGRLMAEAGALTRLNEASSRLWQMPDLSEGLHEMLTATIDLLGADMGNIQLLEGGILRIAVQHGFKPDFLEFFREVTTADDSACGRALRAGARTLVEDIETDTLYEPLRRIARAAGYRGVQSTPLMGRDGKPLGMISTHFRSPHRPDEQDLRRLDLYVRQAADFIERCNAEQVLRQYAQDLAEADRRKDEFLAMLAHELRNPLAPIRNAATVLRRTNGSDREVIGQATEMIERQLNQMVRFVDDLLDVSRVSRGTIELRKQQTELASVIHHAVEAARPAYDGRGHELTLTLSKEPVYLDVDPARLAQVVGNLLSNASKFTDPGGHISLTAGREGQQAVVRVRDTGIGIAPENLSRIFDLFTQLDTSLERSQSGLGIGLTLVKRLVEMHGGTIEAYSPGIGQGSEFVVRLPVLEMASKPLPPDSGNARPPQVNARRILVVDDNHDSATSLAMLLKLSGHETHTAHDGLEAIETAAAIRPDVVLLDIGMPKLNGYEAAREIRQQAWGKNILLVALTGWGQEENQQRSREAGFNGHLVKPVELSALIRILAESQSGR
jgi:PAS domain S-box-containing protein